MPFVMALVLAATTTTTSEAPRIVGDPLPVGVWLAAGAVVLVAIVLAGWWVARRQR
jgi:hypothetical protein